MSNYWLIRSRHEIDVRLDFLREDLHTKSDDMFPMALDIKKYRSKRTLTQNNLHWMWCQELAEYISARPGKKATKDEVHDLMRHKFLGYEDRVVGKTIIPQQLRSTTELDTGEMFYFMEQMEHWATEIGCHLTIPVASEYNELRESQHAT